MQLTFAPSQIVGSGTQPGAIHTPENIVQVIYVGDNGSIYATEASTPFGEWANREFNPAYMICDDVDVEYMKLKYIASSIFVVWKNATEEGEVVPYQEGVTHSVRHRFAVWSTRHILTDYLYDGSVELSIDDPVARLSMTLENPGYILSYEEDSLLAPGVNIILFFRSGDSERYIMGRYYIDKNDMTVADPTTTVEARNTIGKLLKDQTFNEFGYYPKQNLGMMGESIMTKASLTNFWVATTAEERGMLFPPDTNFMEGFTELIKTIPTWKLQEDLTGSVGFGPKTDPRFPQPSTYPFYRNTDIFSRSVARDDADAYARVCVKAEGAGSVTTGTVTVSLLNIRSGPDTSYSILGTLTNNDVITIIQDLGNGWLKMSFSEITEGYVWAAYVSVSKTTVGDFYAYADVDFRFVMGRQKTLHVTAAKETSAEDAQTYANELAALLGSVGTIETFEGPFRPYLWPGDNARIIGTTTKFLGVITVIRHKFGKGGFKTEFTVDSGMVAGKTKISDYINKITKAQTGGDATRLY